MQTSYRWFLIGLFFLALIPRAVTIHYGTNVDEGVYWVEGKQLYEGYWMYRDTQFNKTPLIALAAVPFFWIDEAPIYPIRITMLALSLLGLYCIYRLTRELFGQWAAVAALALMILEPFSCVWAKYLHTSSWTPWLQAAILWLWISALKTENRNRMFVSGLVLGCYALTKQTAIYMIPLMCLGWLFFAKQKSIRSFCSAALLWGGGCATIFLPFLMILYFSGIFPQFWHDTWTAHHKIAAWFAHHTLEFRLKEWWSIVKLAPALWFLAVASPLFLFMRRYRVETGFVLIWLLIEVGGNVLFFTHVWRHYFLGVMLPFAVLSGAVLGFAAERVIRRWKIEHSVKVYVGLGVFIAAMMLPFWRHNDWFYPGITLAQERNLAKYVANSCKDPYLLNLTNPALYVWADKEIPPVYEGGRLTRIPYFMTLAGRGYSTREDIEMTVEYWKTLPLNCIVSYDRYIPQIEQNPVLEPLKHWLLEEFTPRRVSVSLSYYGNFLLFERNRRGP